MVETGQCKMIERPCCSMSTAHFFQLYHGENMLDFDKTNMLYWIFYHTRGQPANHYITDAGLNVRCIPYHEMKMID